MPITSRTQRRQYKSEFDNNHAEYMKLFYDKEEVTQRFTKLERALNQETDQLRQQVGVFKISQKLFYMFIEVF